MPIKQQQELFFASGVRNSADTWLWVNESFGCLEMWTTWSKWVESLEKFGPQIRMDLMLVGPTVVGPIRFETH